MTYEAKTTHERFVKGFVCRAYVEEVYPNECPFVGNDVLQDAGYEAERIWVPWSVYAAKVLIATVWMIGFILLSAAIGGFIVYQTGRASRRIRSRDPQSEK